MKKPFNKDFPLTQGFGENPANYARFNLKGHNGLDYGLPISTEVVAPHSGKIIEAANDSKGYGNYLKIENDKEGSVLAHLKEFKVRLGDQVTEGQLVALSNNTGNSTGPHLHWGYYLLPRDRSNGYAGFIDQLPLLGQVQPAQNQQKVIDQLREERDKNWRLYQECLGKETDYQKRISDLQKANASLEGKIVDLTKTLQDNHLEDYDSSMELIKVKSLCKDLQKEADAIAFAVGVAPYQFQEVLAGIDKLRIPVENAVKPVLQQRNELFDIVFKEGLALFKRFRPSEGFFEKILSWFRK